MRTISTSTFFMAFVVYAVPASAAVASFNIDLGDGPVPSTVYGAAASQPGVWNALSGPSYSLTDTAGNPTSVTFTYSFALTTNGAFNHPGTAGDDEALMDDFATWSPGGPMSFYVVNLPPGVYKFFSYSFAPNGANSWIDIPTGSLEGFQLLGGAWPGSQQLGVTYALHTVTLGEFGDVEILVGVWDGAWGGFNGLQIVQVPEPATIGLLAAGALGLLARRRRQGCSHAAN